MRLIDYLVVGSSWTGNQFAVNGTIRIQLEVLYPENKRKKKRRCPKKKEKKKERTKPFLSSKKACKRIRNQALVSFEERVMKDKPRLASESNLQNKKNRALLLPAGKGR